MNTDPFVHFLQAINNKDATASLFELEKVKLNMRDPVQGPKHIDWITTPANLSTVHTALMEQLKVSPKMLAIRRGVINRTQRAVFLVQAMENSIKRI